MCDTLMSHKSTCVSGSDVFISSLNPVQMEEINKTADTWKNGGCRADGPCM